MLKVLGGLAALVTLAIAVLFVVAATRPDGFAVSRSRLVKATPERIFPLIEDLRAFNTWNPFVASEPGMPLTYSGPAKGPGATNAFGPGSGGAGTLAIVEAQAPSRVVMRLDMTSPMAAQNQVEFSLRPEGEATRVTWTMQGNAPLMAKVVHLFIDADKMVGGQFEKGLADLARRTEN